jgi:polysaccharide export outer membrane protein
MQCLMFKAGDSLVMSNMLGEDMKTASVHGNATLRRPWQIFALLCLMQAASCSFAQTGMYQGSVKQYSADVLKDFEPSPNQEYELGDGDEITLTVPDRPELSGKHTIGPDGRITLPLIGEVRLTDRTRTEAASDVRDALSKYYQNISGVTVSVDHYTSNRILLLGAVDHPGVMSFENAPTLLEVLSRAGITGSANQVQPLPTTGPRDQPAFTSIPELCIIYRGEQTAVEIQLRKMLSGGNRSADVRLKRGDVVYIPGEHAYVSVMGSVLRPGLIRLETTSTLSQLLAQAGGLGERSGVNPQIYVIHPASLNAPGTIMTLNFKEVLEAKPLHTEFRSGDVVFVAESGFNHVADVLQKISPLINLVTVAALIGR